MVKLRPILMSTPMVQANKKGIKIQTRRTIEKDCATLNHPDSQFVGFTHSNKTGRNTLAHFKRKGQGTFFAGYNSKYGAPGDLLWVRETFLDADDYACSDYDPEDPESGDRYSFKADCPDDQQDNYIWKPSIHMPKEACRLFLEITDIRVERLNDISEADAIAEGIERWESPVHAGKVEYLDYDDPVNSRLAKIGFINPITSYMSLWESINGRGSWKANPFVWVVDYKIIDKLTVEKKEVNHAS